MTVSILSYHIKHKRDFTHYLNKAKIVANYAVLNKMNKTLLSSKYVKHIGLPSAISNQILRKYGRGTIKEASNVNLIVPGQGIRYDKKTITVTLIPLKVSFRWDCGREFVKINQVEIDNDKFMIAVTFNNRDVNENEEDIISLDLNCGYGRHIINAVDHKRKHVINLGKNGPHIRHKYFKLRQKLQSEKKYEQIKKISDREKRITRDMDHKMSNKIVEYARKNNLKIIMEDLKGIRKCATKNDPLKKYEGKGFKTRNRLVNSWSFYRLQSMITYKAELHGIPVKKVPPHYTSQTCSYCRVIGTRDRKTFQCNNKLCMKKMNSDINAAYCVGKRYKGIL